MSQNKNKTSEETIMKNNNKFYICEHCGNIINKVNDSGVPVVCCGQKMKEIVPGTVEASREKHIPVVTVEGDVVKVVVGAVNHPMAEEHSILWVQLETDKGSQRKYLEVGAAPEVSFTLNGEKAVAVYAYCNLHGLWKAEV
jgi:superoxide reductase